MSSRRTPLETRVIGFDFGETVLGELNHRAENLVSRAIHARTAPFIPEVNGLI